MLTMLTDAQRSAIKTMVRKVIEGYVIRRDQHTHLFPPEFAEAGAGRNATLFWDATEYFNYHYVARQFRRALGPARIAELEALAPDQQADWCFREMFLNRVPTSAALIGSLSALSALDFNHQVPSLQPLRDQINSVPLPELIARTFSVAKVESAVMTNDWSSADEWPLYARKVEWDRRRFVPAGRLDTVLDPPRARRLMSEMVGVKGLDGSKDDRKRMFDALDQWVEWLKPVYLAVSFNSAFRYDESEPAQMLREVVIELAKKYNVPVFLMIEVLRQVNPRAKLAGDTVDAPWDLTQLHAIARENPGVNFLVTPLTYATHYPLTVDACAFENVHPTSIWWFNLQPSLMEAIWRMRMEMLGSLPIPMHSDARHLFHLVMKWQMWRDIYPNVLGDQMVKLAATGYPVTEEGVRKILDEQFNPPFLQAA